MRETAAGTAPGAPGMGSMRMQGADAAEFLWAPDS